MKLHNFLHRTCVIIPLLNSVTVCGERGPCARCAGYFQHVVLYTIVKYSVQYGWKKSLNRGNVVRFEHSSGFLLTEIHADLLKVYGNGALKYATVCKWVRSFNDGRQSIENDPLVGRPVSILTEKNIATVKTLIEEDARYTLQVIEELSVLKILT